MLRNLREFVLLVIREIYVVCDARIHARVGLKKRIHSIFVPGQNHHQVIALVFHHLQQYFNRFLTIVTLILRAVQIVGLVDEQHAAHGFI